VVGTENTSMPGLISPTIVEVPELIEALENYFKTVEADSSSRAVSKAKMDIAEALLYSLEVPVLRRKRQTPDQKSESQSFR